MKNKIITSEGNIQFVFGDSGKVINIHPFHIFTSFNEDTISFIQIALPKSSGLALMTSTAEDLEVNGSSYSFEQLKDVLAEEFAEAGAQARAEVVQQLPVTGKTNTIYLVPKAEGSGYDEYIYIKDESKWELLGDTDIELSRYMKKSDFNTYSAETKTVIDSKLDASAYTPTDLSDWNENNSGSTAYIKNRTHYTYEGYSELVNSTVALNQYGPTHGGYTFSNVNITEGKTYKVVIDEDEYIVTASTWGGGAVGLNIPSDASSPFTDTWSMWNNVDNLTISINNAIGKTKTIKLYELETIVVPLENKYLGLPISGNTDNGNIIANYFNNSISNNIYGCFAEGYNNKIISGSNYSHTEGYYNTISSGSEYSHAEGYSNFISGSSFSHNEGQTNTISNSNSSHVEGEANTISNSYCSHVEGYRNEVNNNYEHASGQYNNSVSASTTFGNSGNTLFSVGNGDTLREAKHNAFEIRQDGSIYIPNLSGGTDYYDRPMIKLQDIISQLEARIQALENGN